MTEQRETVLQVHGMSCSSCVRHVDEALRRLEGVEVIEVRLSDGRVRVRHDAERSIDAMIEALQDAGYEGAPAV